MIGDGSQFGASSQLEVDVAYNPIHAGGDQIEELEFLSGEISTSSIESDGEVPVDQRTEISHDLKLDVEMTINILIDRQFSHFALADIGGKKCRRMLPGDPACSGNDGMRGDGRSNRFRHRGDRA